MAAFALNSKYIPEFANSALIKGDKGEFSIISELDEISINNHSKFILLRPVDKEFLFTNEGKITSKARIVKLPASLDQVSKAKSRNQLLPKDKFKHIFKYEINNTLSNNNTLNDLKYSLRIVYNFYKPESHFSQQFRDINTDDYQTIVNGWIYTVRTAFGKIVNALPKQNRLEFMLFAMDEFKTIDFVKIPLIQGIEFLNSYVEKRILSRGNLLVSTDKLIRKNLKDIIDAENIGFVDEITGSEKNISSQSLIFKKLQTLKNKGTLKEYLNKSINSNLELETYFNKMFKSQTWPIDLRI